MAEARREEEKVIPIDGKRAEDEARPAQGSDGEPTRADTPAATEGVLAAEFQKLKAEKEELLQTLIRRQADYENFRKRTERERHEAARRGAERLIEDLVPVLDAFDRALKAHDDPAYEEYRKGVSLIRKQLWDTLARHDVQRIEAAEKMFDPNLHQAIERVETQEYPDGMVVGVFQDGFMLHGRVLRPAIVRVAVHPSTTANPTSHENEN
jgi:molecular chaperone GrpE